MVVFTEWWHIGASNMIEITMVMIFVGAFEMSWGPILWLYLAEVCTDKAIAMAVFANWTSSLIVGQITPYMLDPDWLGNYTFGVYAGLCAASTIFIAIFMKETKGLNEQQCKTLYAPNSHKSEDGDDYE
jgi:SP family xylose:H+ symportor-like MFS transporter